MINPVTFAGMPTFGAAAVKVQPSSPVPYVNGYLAADILPAQHLNWFLANLVGDDNLGGAALNHVIAELDGLITGTGAAVAPGDDTQVSVAVNAIAVTVAKTYEARTKDLPLKILEIGVTMSWKKDGKDKSLTLNTMKTVKPQV